MKIRPKNDAKSLWDVNEEFMMNVLLYPLNDEVPCPWDADIKIDNDIVTIAGGIGPSGVGSCICKFQVKDFSRFYNLDIPDGWVSDYMSDEDLQAIWDAGWERA